jgi:hypothetical protein
MLEDAEQAVIKGEAIDPNDPSRLLLQTVSCAFRDADVECGAYSLGKLVAFVWSQVCDAELSVWPGRVPLAVFCFPFSLPSFALYIASTTDRSPP